MSKTGKTQITLNLVVDKDRDRVLFAEADYRFVDILFSFMTLPMGTIVRIIGKKFPIGSFNTLYEGLSNLPSECFWEEEHCKAVLLNPINSSDSFCSKLELNIEDTLPTKYYACWKCHQAAGCRFFSISNSAKCSCGKLMNMEMNFLRQSNVGSGHGKGGIFVNETATFIITDDLCVIPNLPSSSIQILNDLGFTDMTYLEVMSMTVGIQEVLKLLRLAFFSTNPLTNLFLRKMQKAHKLVKGVPVNISPPQVVKQEPASGSKSKKFNAKAFVRKSNGKLLFLQAKGDFIDFLFSFLTIPLGTVKCLLSGTNLTPNIDNLYTSLSNLNVGQYMKSQCVKKLLLQPPLPRNYLCKNQIFSLNEDIPLNYFSYESWLTSYITPSVPKATNYQKLRLRDPMLDGEFVKGTSMFMVTNDLVVTPLSSITFLSYLGNLKVPPSDVAEHEVSIGIEEASGILKASLSSSSPLSCGLKHLLLSKKPMPKTKLVP